MISEMERARIKRLMVEQSAAIDKYADDGFGDVALRADKFADDLGEWIKGQNLLTGWNSPWDILNYAFRFRPGEFTVWSGAGGSGKSLIIGQCILHFIKREAKCLIASLEMKPMETLGRMLCQHYMTDRLFVKEGDITPFLDTVKDSLWLYREVGNVTPKRVHALAKYARIELGCDHLVVDSLMKCGIPKKDPDAIDAFYSGLQNIAKQLDIHVHLVTHKRKTDDKGRNEMSGEDISGSHVQRDIADNVILIQRNITKENAIEQGDTSKSNQPDATLMLDKQRHGSGKRCTLGLWMRQGQIFSQQS